MDYLDILKKAWHITWRYKALWVLGLFAGTAGGGSGGGGGSGYNATGDDITIPDVDRVADWVVANVGMLIAAAVVLFIIGIAFFVLSVAAQGGLIHGANQAAEGRRTALREAWGVGFSRWGRIFMTGFVLTLPVLAGALLIVGILTAAGIGAVLTGEEGLGLAIGTGCLVLPVLGVATIVAGVAAGILTQLALRYGVIYDITFGEAIKRSWDDLWGKKGAFMFWLVMLLPGFAFALAVIVVMMPFLVPGVLLLMRGEYAVGAVLIALMVLAMFLPQAIYSTFVSSAWTVFFRRMTGLEPSPAAVRAAGPPPVAPYAPVPAEPPSVPPSPAAPAPFVVPEEAPIVDVPPPDRPPSDG